MKDKNTVIGFVLLGVLFFVYFWYNNKQQHELAEYQQKQKDSIAKVEAANRKPLDTVAARIDSLKRDSVGRLSAAGDFSTAGIGTEQLVTLENKLMKVTFSSKGGQVRSAELIHYPTPSGKKVLLGSRNQLGYNINTSANQSASTANLFFAASEPVRNPDSSQTIRFTLTSANGQSITHEYTIRPLDYMIDWNILITGADRLLSQGSLNMQWHVEQQQQEKTIEYERQVSHIGFSEGNDFDYISAKTEHKFEKPVQWVGVVQQFFNTTLLAKNSFTGGQVNWARRTDTNSHTLATADVALQLKVQPAAAVSVPLQFYYGPNDYNILRHQAPEMDRMVNLGRDMYSFVRPINKYIIKPVFDFFTKFVGNFGIVILLLTLFIRLVTAPLTYSSYLSGAKMKVLRPELDGLKKKFGDDKQGYAMEQMKLFREAGVSPVGGCVPALLQIPIFFALYSFFNSNIQLRGQSFLWSHDLSAYDSIANLPFSLPGYGDHVSLFTLTAVITSFLISIYNMSMTPTQDNPALKYMPYIFPFMLLFIFNRLPSALTWYYTVSNIITLGLQFVIQNYIIDHDKILAKMEQKRKAPKTKSKWQERYDQMMESQKKLQEMKSKTQNKK